MRRYSEYKDSGIAWIGRVPTSWDIFALRYTVECLDGKRIPVETTQRAEMQGNIPYWGAGNIVDYVDKALFDEELILLGEDGAPFFDHFRSKGAELHFDSLGTHSSRKYERIPKEGIACLLALGFQ